MVKTIPNNENSNKSLFPSQRPNSITKVRSSNLFANREKKSTGRPPKLSNPLDNFPTYSFNKILEKHRRIQEYDEYSKLFQFFLMYGCAGNSNHRLRNYLILPTSGVSHRGIRQSSFLKNDQLPFFRFLTIVIERTAQNICLNEYIVDLLIEMAETFSGCIGPNPLEKTRKVFMGNALKCDHVNYFMDFFLFDEIISIFGEWKKLFFEKILNFV